MWYMHNYGGWGMGWGALIMGVICIGLIGLAIWGIVRLTRHGRCCSTAITTGHTPLDIAKERYAKGEITKEQFEQIKKDLI